MDEKELKGEVLDGTGGWGRYAGPELTAMQYEVLCRHAISRELGVPLGTIKSGYRAAPSMEGRKLKHQIDLYWTSGDGVCEYLVFANAKWQRNHVSLPALMTLIGVQHDIHAQKAMLMTNSGYSPGVVAHAREKGIALLIVRPVADLEVGRIPDYPREWVTAGLESVASERVSRVYTVNYVHKSFGPGGVAGPGAPVRPAAVVGGAPIVGVSAAPAQAMRPASVPNKMMPSAPAPRGPGSFGIRRK
jgi:hypothetical protein